MKRLLFILFALAGSAVAQTSVQKNNSGVVSNGPVAFGSGNTLSALSGATVDFTGATLIGFGSGGVNQIIAGTNVTISPSGGTGNVTINATGGGGGSPGGSTGQVQFNNSGSFGGASGLTFSTGALQNGSFAGTLGSTGQTGLSSSSFTTIGNASDSQGWLGITSTSGSGNGPYINFSDTTGNLGYVGSSNSILTDNNRNMVVRATNGMILATNQTAPAIAIDSSQNVSIKKLTSNGLVATSGGTGLLGTVTALPNGTTATTQSMGDNTTKVATDAFVLANGGGGGGGVAQLIAGANVTLTPSNGLGTVTVAASGTSVPPVFNVMSYGATGNGSTDDTTAVQAAITAAGNAGGGIVYFPTGTYLINGNGVFTPLTGTGIKTLLYMPVQHSASIVIKLLGPLTPVLNEFSEGPNPAYAGGAIIKTTMGDSSGGPALLAGGDSGGFQNFANDIVIIQDLTFRCPTNPQITAINLSCVEQCLLEGVLVDTGISYAVSQPQPTNTTSAGIVTPTLNNGTQIIVDNCSVLGFYSGMVLSEWARVTNTQVGVCQQGYLFTSAAHTVYAGWIGAQWCPIAIAFSTNSVGSGVIPIGIDDLDVENAPTNVTPWYNAVWTIYDPSNLGQGRIGYYVEAGGGGHGAFTQNGGTGLNPQVLYTPTGILGATAGRIAVATGPQQATTYAALTSDTLGNVGANSVTLSNTSGTSISATSSFTASGATMATFLQPTFSGSTGPSIIIGQSNTTGNASYFFNQYLGAANISNAAGIGMVGASVGLRVTSTSMQFGQFSDNGNGALQIYGAGSSSPTNGIVFGNDTRQSSIYRSGTSTITSPADWNFPGTVTIGTPVFSGALLTSGLTISSANPNALSLTDTSGTGVSIASFLQPSATGTEITVGIAGTASNAAVLGFNYSGSGSALNQAFLGVLNHPIFQVDHDNIVIGPAGPSDNGNGIVQLPSTTTTTGGIAFGNDTSKQATIYRSATSTLTSPANWIFNGDATFNGAFALSGAPTFGGLSITGASPGTITVANSSSTGAVLGSFMQSSLATSGGNTLAVGQSAALSDAAVVDFSYVGAGSTSNAEILGVYNHPILTLDHDNAVFGPANPADNGNGLIQLVANTTATEGIAFGNDVAQQTAFYRSAASTITSTANWVFSNLTTTTGLLTANGGISATTIATGTVSPSIATNTIPPVQASNTSASGSTVQLGTFLAPNATGTTLGTSPQIAFGVANTTNDSTVIQFLNVGGLHSTSNKAAFGLNNNAAAITVDGSGNVALPGPTSITGNLSLTTAGNIISVKAGTNASSGTVTLVAGNGTITSTAITVNSVIFFSEKTLGGTPGIYQPLAAVSSGSATVTSAVTDTSTYNWIAMAVTP